MHNLELNTQLDAYYQQIKSVILDKQHPVSGLLPASTAITVHGNYQDAWVRDNVYSILAVWGLALAYRKVDSDDGRGYELQQRTVKLMRGLLRSMMAQSEKIEVFKKTRNPIDALHAKYDTITGDSVVGDAEWGHLQIDATSVFLLTLTQMIASGLDVIWSDEEVCFIQNLVYYIERAYRTPDFGIWERGAKSNSGSVELNASSLGMAKAALEALSGFNLYGAKGSLSSVIHVIPDNIAQSNITLSAMLPRESNTKEIDAALLSVIGFPAFAVPDKTLSDRVRTEIVTKLEGRYGLKRFLRDGHQTVLEDEGRLHYEDKELKQFENIESEWPLFYAYLYLDAIFTDNKPQIKHYRDRLNNVLVEQNGFQLLPELYFVPAESIDAERAKPQSQNRLPNENVPLVWAQSLFLLGTMLEDGLLRPGDLDPLGRRHGKPKMQPVVQLIFLAEDELLQQELAAHGVATETLSDIAPVKVYRPEDIAAVHGQVGRCDSLGLTGRIPRMLKSLTTSRVYMFNKQRAVCLTPSFMQHEYFLSYDIDFLVRRFKSELSYLHSNWTEVGRPTVTVLLTHNLLDGDRSSFFELMAQIATGEVDDIPVKHGAMAQLTPTSAVERVEQLNDLVLPSEPLRDLFSHSCALSLSGNHLALTSDQEREIDSLTDANELHARLEHSNNLYQQIALLAAMSKILSLDSTITYHGQHHTVRSLIEEIYLQAGRLRLWSVLRHASGLLGKLDGDLGLAVSALLVAQKFIQVGRAYSDESLISKPLQDDELLAKINQFCREDVRDQVLTQEVLLSLGMLVKSRPKLFSELLTVRVSYLIVLLTSQISREHNKTPDEAYEHIMNLAPSEIQDQIEAVLEEYQNLADLPIKLEELHAECVSGKLDWDQDSGFEELAEPTEGWYVWRQHQGVIDRRPAGFIPQVWSIFKHTTGLVIGNKMDKRNRVASDMVLSDMTQGEAAFALLIEQMLNNIQAPEYRQLTVETMSALGRFFEQNPSLQIDEALIVDVTIGHAVHLAYSEVHPERMDNYAEHKGQAWDSFYHRSPMETTLFIVSALRKLLTLRSASEGLASEELASDEIKNIEAADSELTSDKTASDASPAEAQE